MERLVIEEHRRIVDALEAGDPDLAVGRMAEHLNRASAMYQQEHIPRPRASDPAD